MDLFRIGVRSKIMDAVYSRSAKRRRWGFDAMFDSYDFGNHPFASARWAAPAPRKRSAPVVDVQAIWERETAAELAREQAAELDADRRREQAGEETRADIESARALRAGSLWLVDRI
jgi:hypothetical protein